jgi:hypothetical protein
MNKDIRTHHPDSVCDICGRSLLRGERAEAFLGGGVRHTVCELCKTRALHEGWVREGSVPEFESGRASAERRRTLLGRLRKPRGRPGTAPGPALGDGVGYGDRLGGGLDHEVPTNGLWDEQLEPAQVGTSRSGPGGLEWSDRLERSDRRSGRDRSGSPRHVKAVPTSEDQKVASAIDVFNRSEHRRTVAGVARSLGAPGVSIAGDADRQSLVWIVFAWELCWYRYEVNLSDDGSGLRLDARGYELEELSDHERVANAVADEAGQLRVR